MKSQSLKLLIKSVVVVGLLYFLAKKGMIQLSLKDTHRALTQLDKIVPAMGALIATSSLLGVLRWQWLLEAQGIHLSWKRTFQLTFVGLFFNIALPGAVSGDIVKAFYIGREMEGQRARAFGSILFDRVVGVSALVLVAASALAFGFSSFYGTKLFMGIQFLLTLAAAGVIGFFGYLFLMSEKHDPMLRVFRWAETKAKAAGSLTRIYEGLRHYHSHRWTVAKTLILSVIIHLIVGWACLKFAEALGETDLKLLSIYVIVPLGLLVTAVPVMPAGIGTGHLAFAYLFGLIGSQKGGDIFTLFAFTQIIIGGLGGLIYLRFKSHLPESMQGVASSPLSSA